MAQKRLEVLLGHLKPEEDLGVHVTAIPTSQKSIKYEGVNW